MPPKRTAFFISDRTGITAEMLGRSLLTQFESIPFQRITVPFVDSPEQARSVVERINQTGQADGVRPIVFSTVIDKHTRAVLATANALMLDFFQIFIIPLEGELGVKSSHTVGRFHSANDMSTDYQRRIEAINFTLAHDDGATDRGLDAADIILVGVSRSGKTPTCLYMAMQFGIRAANYPLIPEDFNRMQLPKPVIPYRSKLFGLTISPERLSRIREERRPNSTYASLANCQAELRHAEAMMSEANVPFLDATTKSIEEIATTILQRANLGRNTY